VRKDPKPRPIVGWREWIALPDLHIPDIKAKIDTGARTSALHAYDVSIVEKEDGRYARFKVHPIQRDEITCVEAEAPLVDERRVRSSSGQEEHRPVILTTAVVRGLRFHIEITLTRRDAMGFRMLLGRRALRRRFHVDPGRSYYGGKPEGTP
jgi:hypothetical protein